MLAGCVARQKKMQRNTAQSEEEKSGKGMEKRAGVRRMWQKGIQTSEEAGARLFVAPFALSFGFVHSSFSVVAELCFMAAGVSALREKG